MTEQPSAPLLGRTEPRLATLPLVTGAPGPCGCGCALTPDTTLGFDVESFARDIVGMELLPWQRHLVIHAMELLPDGTPRFRIVLVLVARQNGKTTLLALLALYWLYVLRVPLVLGTSTSLDTAKESWEKAVTLAESTDALYAEIAPNGVRKANGEQQLKTIDGCRYKIAAANRRGGRGLTVHRLIADELLEHQNWEAWGAAFNAMNAVPDGQAWALSNAGHDGSVVLNHFRSLALAGTEQDIGIFEWSGPEGCELNDEDALAQANPSVGYTTTWPVLMATLMQPPAQVRAEVLCQHVTSLDAAVNLAAWQSSADPEGTMDAVKDRVSLCFDVSLDMEHATLCAAAVLPDGRTRVEVVDFWTGTKDVRAALEHWRERIKPRAFGWFPNGPGAALAADLAGIKSTEPIKGSEVTAVCQGFAEQVAAGRILHDGDALLTAHVAGAKKLYSGDGWRFTRRGIGHVDALYAAAGAVHLARTAPAGPGRVRYIRGSRS